MSPHSTAPALLATATLASLAALPALAGSEFDVGTWGMVPDLREANRIAPHDSGGWAIPLRGSVPKWYTPELREQVLAVPGTPVAAPVDAPLPSEVGIRPGAWMVDPAGCTMNFVFYRGDALAIGTAGHCVGHVGQHVVLLTIAPNTGNPVLVDIGEVIARRDKGVGDDFALVGIRRELHDWVNATAAMIGGPCGPYGGAGPERVSHYGQGLVVGTGGTPRVGVALGWTRATFDWDSPSIFGDAGSPVRVGDLKAAGILTHLVVDTRWVPSRVAGTRIGRMLAVARGWSLANSPVCLNS